VKLQDPVLYSCAGLAVRSGVWLPAAPLQDQGTPPDVEFVFGGARALPPAVPPGNVLADLIVDGYPQYTFCRVNDHFVGRFYGLADFVITGSLDRVVCHPLIAGRSHDSPILMSGAVASFIASMKGRLVLHASAIDLGGLAVAFAGERGQGKTTLATLFCAAGYPLVTDDVLPIEFGHDAVYGLRSGHELRLRSTAATLVERFTGPVAQRTTTDDPRAIRPLMTAEAAIPLVAVLMPRPDRERSVASARRLGAAEAGLALGRCHRIEGWRQPEIIRRNFAHVGALLDRLPVYEVAVPWGPPFAEDLVDQVLAACPLPTSPDGRRRDVITVADLD
jgi:hypothetical protein